MMMRLVLISVLLAGTAACDSQPSISATNASVADVAKQIGAAAKSGQFVSPGRWEGNVTIAKVDVPGAPPAMAERMRTAMAKPYGFVSCLTPEEAKQPKGSFFGGDSDKDCRYDHFTMAGGAIDAKMTCSAGGMNRTMVMKGRYSPDAYSMDATSSGEGTAGQPMSAMTMTMAMQAKRTGACKGNEQD